MGSRPEFLFESRDAFGLGVAGGLALAQEERQFVKLCFEGGLGALAVLQARFELAFAQRYNVGADFEICLRRERTARFAAELLLSAPAALIERLHPKRLGDVRDGFGESMERGGTGVKP